MKTLLLAEIASVAGEIAAVQLAAYAGGTRVYIPVRTADNHWLVQCVGRKAADQICAAFAVDGRGQRVDIPLGSVGAYPQLRRAIAKRIHDLDKAKDSSRKIAASVGVTQRTVHRHRRAHRVDNKDSKQGKLL